MIRPSGYGCHSSDEHLSAVCSGSRGRRWRVCRRCWPRRQAAGACCKSTSIAGAVAEQPPPDESATGGLGQAEEWASCRSAGSRGAAATSSGPTTTFATAMHASSCAAGSLWTVALWVRLSNAVADPSPSSPVELLTGGAGRHDDRHQPPRITPPSSSSLGFATLGVPIFTFLNKTRADGCHGSAVAHAACGVGHGGAISHPGKCRRAQANAGVHHPLMSLLIA